MTSIDIRPLSPLMHPAYLAAMQGDLPEEVSAEVRDLVSRRNTAPDDEIESIDGQLVDRLYWYALHPDEIAARVMARHHLRSPVSVEDATLILAALGEAGYPIHGNGAPDYAGRRPRDPAPVSGAERAQVIWSAAQYWASVAAEGRYVSLGDRADAGGLSGDAGAGEGVLDGPIVIRSARRGIPSGTLM